jgi:hypothetical protein
MKKNDFLKNNIIYLFVSGSFSNETQAAKYIEKYTTKSTNEQIKSKNGINVIGENIYVVNGNEVYNKDKREMKIFSYNPIQLLNNLKNLICQKISYSRNTEYNISVEMSNSTKTCSSQSINFTNYTIGMGKDSQNVVTAFDKITKENPNSKIVLYGVSRGCASICNSLEYLEKNEKFENIQAIVLEGCFDSFENLFYERFCRFYFIYYLITKLLLLITGYDQNENKPIEVMKKVFMNTNKNIPNIMLISSKRDKEVPIKCTINIYESLLKIKKLDEKIFFITLNNSSHPRYTLDDEKDINFYKLKMHEFYKISGLPYILDIKD